MKQCTRKIGIEAKRNDKNCNRLANGLGRRGRIYKFVVQDTEGEKEREQSCE